MKKLALAPAVAIAITGLAASPVIATPSAPADALGQANVVSPQSKTPTDKDDSDNTSDDDAESQTLDAKISVSPKQISQTDLADKSKGVTVTVTGLEEGDEVSDDITEEDPEVAKGDSVSYTIYNKSGDPEAIAPGTIKGHVTVERDGATQTEPISFEVTEDDSSDEPSTPAVDPKVSPETTKISQSDFKKNGIKVTGEGFTPKGKVTVVGAATQSSFGTTDVTADDEGKISAVVKYEGDEGLEPGHYAVTAVDQETEATADPQNFTITEDKTEDPSDPSTPAAEAKLTVSPESITPADFVNEKKGVTLAVENCEPGEDVHFRVTPKGESNVTAYDKTPKADDEGKASVNVYGTSDSNPSAYLGDYDVIVTCGEAELSGDFTVEKDPNAGGSDGDDNGSDGSEDDSNGGGDLPRTGTELTGLVGGGALLLIGGIAVAMTKRRKKTAEDPAEI